MKEEIYIDFDGVIADTQKKIDMYFSQFNNIITAEWDKFLANIKWKLDVLPEAKEINNSFEILKELYKLKKNIYILSRVFSINEARDKIEYLRDNGIQTSFIASPGRIEKSKVIIPNKDRMLIDDSKTTIKDWINNNGRGIFFAKDENDLINNKKIDFGDKEYYEDIDGKLYFKECVNDLSFLLKK